MPNLSKKLIFAAGGTGGHLFPAQALAEQLLKEKPDLNLLFAGANLSRNAYFDRSKFAYYDIQSMTPFQGSLLKKVKSFWTLLKGIFASILLLKREKPDLIVGFGSFHAFPILGAAKVLNIPIVLFESNAIPGKVVRFFSKKALFTGIFFPETKKHLSGTLFEVDIPQKKTLSKDSVLEPQAARQLLGLDSKLLTVLVFGGSQGAKGINKHMLDLVPLIHKQKLAVQWIHFTGNEETTMQMIKLCETLSVPCCVKTFEPRIGIAWQAADLVICRAGAMTLAELLYYEVPGILIPYPFAADRHQLKNALFIENQVKGAVHLPEDSPTTTIAEALISLADRDSPRRLQMKNSIRNFNSGQKKANLVSLILQHFNHHDKN
jgi:UDP-N-acetylglucosamine--N-acetylmuramyl-(pentapeptide) pyrophosphoryl-undecaprenol N-acetylglucosamine transferase